MLSTNEIAGLLNFKISKTIGGINFTFCVQVHILKLQTDDVILYKWSQACPGMPKEAIKTLRSQKLTEV